MSRRGSRVAALLLLAFLLVPILEIVVLIQVGKVIGPWWTILLLVLDSILGAWLIKREGRRAWEALRARIETGRLPARELADGVLVVLGGALMLSPGFVSDAFGILLILPVTRPVFRALLMAYTGRQVVRRTTGSGGPAGPMGRTGPYDDTRPGPTVVRGEVIDEG